MSNERIITINTSTGAPAVQISTIAQTWGELQLELNAQNISYSGMKAIIGETKVTLDSNNSILPEGTMNLFLLPRKTKSGIDKTQKPMKKEAPKKAAPKKAVVKKSAPTKVVAVKKSAPKKSTVINKEVLERVEEAVEGAIKEETSSLKQAAKKIVAEVQKEFTDIEKVSKAMQLLQSVQLSDVRTKLDVINIDLDDIKYIIATGRPRINNLRNQQVRDLIKQTNDEVKGY
jgi:hypothetical protein